MILAPVAVFRPRSFLAAGNRATELGPKARIMGIINVTPDSFSDGGLHAGADSAVAAARRLFAEGADIIDIGGESTRPGAEPVSAIEEQRRVLPVIEALAAEWPAGKEGPLVSIDTYRAETAELALAAGAGMVNDVWGLQREPALALAVSRHGAGLCIMHNGRGRARPVDQIADQIAWFRTSLAIAEAAGIATDRILLDPGFGFAKDTGDNIALMGRLGELHALGLPLLAGTSRKRFIGAITGQEAAARDVGTAASNVVLRLAGAGVFRVHNVPVNREGLAVADAMVDWSVSRRRADD